MRKVLEHMESDEAVGTTFSAADLAEASAKLDLLPKLLDKTSHIKAPKEDASKPDVIEKNHLRAELKTKSRKLTSEVSKKIDQQIPTKSKINGARTKRHAHTLNKSLIERARISEQANTLLLKGMVIVESSSLRCFSRKHDSAKLDLLKGHLFFVMNSLHTLNFIHAVKKLVLLVSTA